MWYTMLYVHSETLPRMPNTNNNKKNHNHKQRIVKVKLNFSWKNMLLYGFLAMFLLFLFIGVNQSIETQKTVSLSQIINDVKEGKVSQIVVTDTKLTVTEKDQTIEATKE